MHFSPMQPQKSPDKLSRELREGKSADLSLRRWIIGFSLLGVAAGMVVGAYQTGLIKRLPDPKDGVFNATRVNASDYAYKRMQTPDGLFMIANYAVTAILAGAGGADRARSMPWLPVALLGKTATDVAVNVKLFVEEWGSNRLLCQYCFAANLASWASALLAAPGAMKAWDALQARDTQSAT
jgi:hypothetical protein